jgi:hypothetical protein
VGDNPVGPVLTAGSLLVMLPIFILSALIADNLAGAVRAIRQRTAAWPQRMRAVVEATAFFNITPNEDAIRQRLAETVSALTGTATVVTDSAGRLKAAAGPDWNASVDDELGKLLWAMLREPRDHIVTRGALRAHLIRSRGELLGVVIWRRRQGERARIDLADEHIELLTDLAAAAIARSGDALPV